MSVSDKATQSSRIKKSNWISQVYVYIWFDGDLKSKLDFSHTHSEQTDVFIIYILNASVRAVGAAPVLRYRIANSLENQSRRHRDDITILLLNIYNLRLIYT
jgi:hypothetical protein